MTPKGKEQMRQLTLPKLGNVEMELCDFLNEEGIGPCDLEQGTRVDLVEVEGFVMAVKVHPGDDMRNAYQVFKKGEEDKKCVALWDGDMWI